MKMHVGAGLPVSGAYDVEMVDYHQERDMANKLQGVHPSEILSEAFIKQLGITNARLASDIDMPTSRISEIVNNGPAISVDTAV